MLRKLNKSNKGFTIIEVLIVLAIAGLIMVVVFLAVPALQRNQKNTQQKTEANNILAAYQELSNNKSGDKLTVSESTTAGSDAANLLAAAGTKTVTLVSITAYAAGTIGTTNSAPTATQVSLSKALVRLGSTCTAADSGVAKQGTDRQVALYFAIENPAGGNPQIQCINS